MAENKPKEERKNEIIEAAVSEFLENGYERASINSIALRAGLSKGGFYHHFKNKDEILFAVNFKFLQPVYNYLQSSKSNPNVSDGLKFFINEYLNYWTSHIRELQFTFLTFNKMIREEKTWDDLSDYSKKITSFFEGMFIKGIMSGVFIKHNPKSRAVALFSALQGITPFLVMNKDFKTANAVEYLCSVFIDEIIKK